MKYSKATSYALHTVLYLVAIEPDSPVGVQKLAEKLHVSPTYLSKILTKLVKSDLIESASGANGGYRLKPRKEDVSFLDVIQAVEGSTSLFECYEGGGSRCVIHQAMIAAEETMKQNLKSKKIIDVAKQFENLPEQGRIFK